jgi:hypothetical protein
MVEVAKRRGGPCRVIIRDYDTDGADNFKLRGRRGEAYVEEVVNLK